MSPPDPFHYAGAELHLFAGAVNWKTYFSSMIQPYLGEEVLEVGAGIGGTTQALCLRPRRRWLCLEPDLELAELMRQSFAGLCLPTQCEVLAGTVADLRPDQQFDSILYVDVLEHIEDDCGELAGAVRHLRADGTLIVLSPAHQFLYTPFDRALGHFRRYSRRSLAAAVPQGMTTERLVYLDAAGMMASFGNRMLLRHAMPTARQIWFWDVFLVRLSRFIDPVLGYSLGKSVLGVWRQACCKLPGLSSPRSH